MRVAYIDCTFGAAGDMLLGSLLGAGLKCEELSYELGKLDLPSQVDVEDVIRCSIQAKKVTVSDQTGNGMHPHRGLKEILAIIDGSGIDDDAKALAKRIFRRLGEAEAKVHGKSIEEIHFHEVGAVDAIVDIVGFAIGYRILEIQRCHAAPLPLGRGTVKTDHGLFPVPGPAVGCLIADAGAPTSSLTLPFECTTPTGAAILTTIVDNWSAQPAFSSINSIGYGAGSMNTKDHPNVVRLFLGTEAASLLGDTAVGRPATEILAVIESDIDDCAPSVLAHASSLLLTEGALDVTVTPTVMKKSRSGHRLSVLCRPADRSNMERIILKETTTIGARCHLVERISLERELFPVKLPGDRTVHIKVARDLSGEIVNKQPEYRECAQYAAEHGMSVKKVYELALAAFQKDN